MKTKIVLLLLAFAGVFASAAAQAMSDSATMSVVWQNGKTSQEKIKLQKISDNTLRLSVPWTKYSRSGWLRIDYIDFFCDDAKAQKGDDGYWVASYGFMGKFKADKGKFVSGKNSIPVYGVKKGDEAFVAIVKGLRWEYELRVEVKAGKYNIFPRFNIKGIGMPIYEDIVIDFTYFKGKDANYSAMGREYRKYMLESGAVKPLKERIKGNPTLKYTTEAVFLKFSMASFMRQGETKLNRGFWWKDSDAPNIQKFRDFDNMMGVLKKLKELGIDKADIIITNWNWRSNGRSPINYMAEPELGGNAKCKQFLAMAKDMGYHVSPHILHTENYTVSPAFNKDDLALQLDGGYIHYNGMGGEAYRPCFHQVYYKQVLHSYTVMRELGFSGPMHIDVTSAINPYPCFNLSHPCTRKDCAYYMNMVGLLSDAFFGGYTSESSVDSTANTLDYVLYVTGLGEANRKRHYPLTDAIVPLWQIAYHGIIMSNPYISTVDYNTYGDKVKFNGLHWGSDKSGKERRLKFIEFGGRLTYYGALVKDKTLEKVAQAYKEYKPLRYLQLEFMDYHGELAKDVYITRYSDGSEVVSNYTDKDYIYKGQPVKPMDYRLFKPNLSAWEKLKKYIKSKINHEK